MLTRLMAVHEDETVGYVDLYGDTPGSRELGYAIAPSKRWAAGLGGAATEAAMTYGFEHLGLRHIWAEAVEANIGSVRVLQRLGMRQTGYGETEPFLGETSRYIRFEVQGDEWLTRSRAARPRR